MPAPDAELTLRGSRRLSWGWGRGLQLAWVPWCSQEPRSPPAAAIWSLFWHWQAADVPSGSSDIMKIPPQEAAVLRVCVHTERNACPDGAGHLCQSLCSTMVLEQGGERAKHQQMSSGKGGSSPCVNESKQP